MPGFVLCDPALMMPPPPDENEGAQFWARLIEWSADHRLRLGPAGYELVVSLLGEFGWPKRDAANYPPGMAQLAHRSLAMLLKQVAAAETRHPPPRLSPRHQPDGGEEAIGMDAAALHESPILGLATAKEHWDSVAESVMFEPPPPESLTLLFEPGASLPDEEDLAVRRFLKDRRVTIVGGVRDEQVLNDLTTRFQPKEVRWFGAEPGPRLNLDGLTGLHARFDVVYCVTGHIGHEGSIKAKKCCRKRGIEMRKVSKAGEIVNDLLCHHGQK
jgi:hypothetical protein